MHRYCSGKVWMVGHKNTYLRHFSPIIWVTWIKILVCYNKINHFLSIILAEFMSKNSANKNRAKLIRYKFGNFEIKHKELSEYTLPFVFNWAIRNICGFYLYDWNHTIYFKTARRVLEISDISYGWVRTGTEKFMLRLEVVGGFHLVVPCLN